MAPFVTHLARLVRAPTTGPEGFAHGDYLTDGRRLFLFRVVARFSATADGVFADLEDCLTLNVRPYTRGELEAMALRPVRRGRSESLGASNADLDLYERWSEHDVRPDRLI